MSDCLCAQQRLPPEAEQRERNVFLQLVAGVGSTPVHAGRFRSGEISPRAHPECVAVSPSFPKWNMGARGKPSASLIAARCWMMGRTFTGRDRRPAVGGYREMRLRRERHSARVARSADGDIGGYLRASRGKGCRRRLVRCASSHKASNMKRAPSIARRSMATYCGAGALGGAIVPGSGRETAWARGTAAAVPPSPLSASCARMYSQ